MGLLDRIAAHDTNFLVIAAFIIIFDKMTKWIYFHAIGICDMDLVCISAHYPTVGFCLDKVPAILCNCFFDTGTDCRRLWSQQWHCLALHVRTGERSVDTVLLHKWHQCGS